MTDFHITRRKFIGTAATVAAFSIVPRHVLAGPNQKSPGEKLNIAVISMAAIKAGKHVYCQKPLTHDVDESRISVFNRNTATYGRPGSSAYSTL